MCICLRQDRVSCLYSESFLLHLLKLPDSCKTQTTTNGMLITSMFVLKHHIMANSVGLADSNVAAEQVVTNILWEGLVAS